MHESLALKAEGNGGVDRNGRGQGSHTHTQARPHAHPRARTHTTPGWLYVPLTYTLQAFHNRNKFKSSPSTTAEGPAGEESLASTAFPARFHGMRLCAQTYTHQLFFFPGVCCRVFFFFLKPAEISCTSIKYPFLRLPLEAKKREKDEEQHSESPCWQLREEGGG